MNQLSVKKLHPEAKLPILSTDHSAGYDLFSLYPGTCLPGERVLIKTGTAIRLPTLTIPGLKVYASIRSRSSLSWKKGIEVGAGVIDFDYTSDVGVILFNHSSEPFSWDKHERVAQMVLEVHVSPPIIQVDELPALDSNRDGGFGSTGQF